MRAVTAAVTMTENGIKLTYDVKYFAKASKEQIDFDLSHELMHVLGLHFLRGEELMAELGIGMSEFYARYAPIADLCVNYSLRDLNDYNEIKKTRLTYEKAGLDYDTYPTFESLVRWLHANPEMGKTVFDKLGLSQVKIAIAGGWPNGEPGSGQGPTIVMVDENGMETVINPGDGKTVVTIPEVSKEAKREVMKDIGEIVKAANRMAGNAPYEIRKAIQQFLDEYNNQVLKGWALLEQLLVGERAINKGSERTYSRLNRRTRLLPGKTRIKGFSAMFVVDESGSMSDDEVQLAFTMVKKVMLQENNDKVYVVHWDTEPTQEVDELQYESDLETLERQRCGGTDFREFFVHDVFYQHDYDLYICVTDGYPGLWPQVEVDKPLVWIITQSGGYESWKQECGKGIAVCVDEDM